METTGREWTVLTWNIQGAKRTDLERLARVISSEAPDVVALQEVREPQATTLAGLLSMTHCWAEKHHFFRPFFPGRAEGAAILTPHDMSAVGHQRASKASSMRSYKRRILQWATITRGDASGYRVYNAHLSPHNLTVERVAEAELIAGVVASHGESPPAIVAGDLNNDGEPEVIAALPGIEVISAPRSNPAHAPVQALDHVLVPVESTGYAISAPGGGEEWAELSDHLPVTVRFTLDWVAGGFAG